MTVRAGKLSKQMKASARLLIIEVRAGDCRRIEIHIVLYE
jgi:hypothetical protein